MAGVSLELLQFAAAWALDDVAVVGATCDGGEGDVRGTFKFVVAAVDTDAILAFVIVKPLPDKILALEDVEMVGIGSIVWDIVRCLLSS